MTKITTEEVEKRLSRGQDISIVDARAPRAWDEAEIKAGGAIRIPPDEAEKHIADVRRDSFVVTYCT